MPDLTASYGKLYDFIAIFVYFFHITEDNLCLKCCIFTELSQIVCLINNNNLVCQHFDMLTYQMSPQVMKGS